MVNLERTLTQIATQTPQAQAQAQASTPAVQAPEITADPVTDTHAYNQQLAAYTQWVAQQQLAAVAAPVVGNSASQARRLSQMDPEYASVWQKYGAEIDTLMAGVAPVDKLSVDIWNRAAELVRGRHWRELAREEAERIAAAGGMDTARGAAPDVVASGNHLRGSPIERFFAEGGPIVERFRKNNVGVYEAREAARRQGYTEEQWVELQKAHLKITEPEPLMT